MYPIWPLTKVNINAIITANSKDNIIANITANITANTKTNIIKGLGDVK